MPEIRLDLAQTRLIYEELITNLFLLKTKTTFYKRPLVSALAYVCFVVFQVWFTAPTFFFFLYYMNLSLYHVLLYELLAAFLSLTLNKFFSRLK